MRYKEFNTNKVLEDCISLFWKNGYGSCSINDIVKKTNVNRFSLYKEFENKEGILLHTLNLYKERYSQDRIALLNQKKPIREALKGFYASYLLETEGHPPGCFMIHISTELADSVDYIKKELEAYIQSIEKSMASLLERNDAYEKEKCMRLVSLFCNSMCFCLIQSESERLKYIEKSLDLIIA